MVGHLRHLCAVNMTNTPLFSAIGLAILGLGVTVCCTPSPKGVPGVNLGAPSIGWSHKNEEQRFGHMAAAVDPQMHAMFKKYDSSYGESFECKTCHGSKAELVDWKMPSDDLYALPKENTLQSSLEYDTEVTNFMMGEVTPALKKLLNTGSGAPVEASCFSCHPVE
jgi:hypothetical protein